MIRVQHLTARRRSFFRGERRCVVRAPTVAAVFDFLDLFAREVVAVWKRYRADPEQFGNGRSVSVILQAAFGGSERLEQLARHVLVSPAVEDLDTGAAKVVCWESMRLLQDPAAVLRSLNLDQVIGPETQPAAADAELPDGVEAQVISIVTVAQAFSIAPHEVLDWPWEEYYAVVQAMNARAGHDPATLDGAGEPLTPELVSRLSALGIGVAE